MQIYHYFTKKSLYLYAIVAIDPSVPQPIQLSTIPTQNLVYSQSEHLIYNIDDCLQS